MKRIVRLTESDIHRIIRESVNRILREEWESPLDKAKKKRNDFDNVKKIDLSKFEKKSKKPKAGTFGDLPSFAKLKNRKDESRLHRIVNESVKKVLKEGFGDGMIERELEKKLKILDSNGTIDKLFGGFYKCQPISFHAVYNSYDPDESGFVFNFKGGVVGKVTLGGIYGFPCDHLSGAETDAFEENINKLIPIIQNIIDNC